MNSFFKKKKYIKINNLNKIPSKNGLGRKVLIYKEKI